MGHYSETPGHIVSEMDYAYAPLSRLESLCQGILEHLVKIERLARCHCDRTQRRLFFGAAPGLFEQFMIFHGHAHVPCNSHEVISLLLVEMSRRAAGHVYNATQLPRN